MSTQLFKAFSILEIIVVLALFALLAGLVLYNIEGLVRSYSQKSVEEVFFDALKDARFEAMARQSAVELHYDEQRAVFFTQTEGQMRIAEYIISWEPRTFKCSIFPRLPAASIAEAQHPQAGNFPLPFLLCTAQGYTPPVQIVLTSADSTSSFWLDPFSASQLFFR